MVVLNRLRSRRIWGGVVTALMAGAGGLSLGIAGNALYGLFSGNDKPDATHMRVAISSLVLGIIFIQILLPLLRKIFAPRFPGSKAAEFTHGIPPRPALITLVSLLGKDGSNPAEKAMAYHRKRGVPGGQPLQHCWLLYTPQSEDAFKQLCKAFPDVICHDVPLDKDAAEDPRYAYLAVLGACAQAQALGLHPEDMIADATGGTKTMTIGMALACRELNLDMEYFSSQYDDDNRRKPDTERVVVVNMSSAVATAPSKIPVMAAAPVGAPSS